MPWSRVTLHGTSACGLTGSARTRSASASCMSAASARRTFSKSRRSGSGRGHSGPSTAAGHTSEHSPCPALLRSSMPAQAMCGCQPGCWLRIRHHSQAGHREREFDRAILGQCEVDVDRKQVILVSTIMVVIVVIVVIVIVAAVVIGLMAARRRRLQQRFGPEYDRLVEERDSKLKAEAELSGRERRVHKLDIRPLTPAARAGYVDRWANIQERFVDEPAEAVAASQVLVAAVMSERGYPAQQRDQVLADLSVEHAKTLDRYRAAEEISASAAAGTASTEDLRQAMIHYRVLFRELLGESADARSAGTAQDVPQDRAAAEAQAGEPAMGEPAVADTEVADTELADRDMAARDMAERRSTLPADEPIGNGRPDTRVQRTPRS